MQVAIIYGSVRSHRKEIKAVRFLEKQLDERKMSYTTVDQLERNLPLLDKIVMPVILNQGCYHYADLMY